MENPHLNEKTSYASKITVKDMEVFVESPIWKAFEETLNVRVYAIQRDFETAEDMDEINRLRGELQGVRFWLRLPETILEELKRDAEQKEKRNA